MYLLSACGSPSAPPRCASCFAVVRRSLLGIVSVSEDSRPLSSSPTSPFSFLSPLFSPALPIHCQFAVDSRTNRISSWLNCCRIPIRCINRVAADAPLAVPRIVLRLVVLSGLIHDSRSSSHRRHVRRTCRTVILLGPHAQRGDS